MESGWTEPLLLGASIASATTPFRHRFFLLNTTMDPNDLLETADDDGRPLPASKASIDALAAVQLPDECAICLEEEHGEEAREMPCKHQFHKKCVEKWLKMSGSCPICRYQMPAEETSRADDDDKYPVGSDEEVRVRMAIVFVSTGRLGSPEAEEATMEEI